MIEIIIKGLQFAHTLILTMGVYSSISSITDNKSWWGSAYLLEAIRDTAN